MHTNKQKHREMPLVIVITDHLWLEWCLINRWLIATVWRYLSHFCSASVTLLLLWMKCFLLVRCLFSLCDQMQNVFCFFFHCLFESNMIFWVAARQQIKSMTVFCQENKIVAAGLIFLARTLRGAAKLQMDQWKLVKHGEPWVFLKIIICSFFMIFLH